MAGYITLGIGFGLVYTSSGFSMLGAVLFSVLVFAGSMQYVSVSLLSTGASPLAMVLMTMTVNLRHIFYSISMLGKYKGAGKYKPYMVFALTDETFSIVCDGAPESFDAPKYYFALSLFNQSYWVTGTILGVLLQELVNIPFTGVDFSMTALFLVTFTDQVMKKKSLSASALGIFIPLVCLMIFGKDSFLIPSLIAIAIILCIAVFVELKKKEERA